MNLLLMVTFLSMTTGHVVSGQSTTSNDQESKQIRRQLETISQFLNKLNQKIDKQQETLQQLDQQLQVVKHQQLDQEIKCQQAIQCRPLQVANAVLSAYNTSYRSTVNVTCNTGYWVSVDVKSTVLTCQADGTWSHSGTTLCKRDVLRPTLTHSIPGGAGVWAIASFNNQLFVTRSPGHNQIEVYDASTFQRLRNIPVPGANGRHLAGLAVSPAHNCLYMSDDSNSAIYKVNLSVTPPTATTWSVARWPRGLSVNRDGNLLVVDESRKIQEFTPNVSLVREITDSNELFHAVELNDGTLAVSRQGPVYGVCVMSVNGTVLRSYGSTTQGSGPGQMYSPLGLAADSQGFILVADGNNYRILVLNPSLTEARTLQLPVNATGQINGPSGLWLDESRGRLFVSEVGRQYRVLVFDGVANLGSAFDP